jgi:hypothetical protein
MSYGLIDSIADYNKKREEAQVLIQTKDKTWITRGVKMTRAQIKRQIEQQISEMKKREQAN